VNKGLHSKKYVYYFSKPAIIISNKTKEVIR